MAMKKQQTSKAEIKAMLDENADKGQTAFNILSETMEKLLNNEISVKEANAISTKAGKIIKQVGNELSEIRKNNAKKSNL